jgi:HSP20 family protein
LLVGSTLTARPSWEKRRKTMALGQWEPQRLLGSLRHEIDKIFEDFFPRWSTHHYHRHLRGEEGEFMEPAVEVAETAETIVVKAEVPGVSKDNLIVEITAEGLTLKGEVKAEKEEAEKRYHRQEICYGPFTRTVPFPFMVESDKVVATLKDGVLQVTVPKSTQGKGRPVKIEVV